MIVWVLPYHHGKRQINNWQKHSGPHTLVEAERLRKRGKKVLVVSS